MAINLATKYSSKVDERFTLASLTESAVNNDYEWDGVKSIHVYSIDTVDLGDYTRSGLTRFGDAEELGDTTKEYVLSQDKAFTFTIDKGNDMEQMGVKNAGRALRREVDEQIIPAVDIYRLSKMVAGAGTSEVKVITAANAYEALLDAQVAMTDAKVPMVGRMMFCSPAYYKFIKLDQNFIKASDIAQNMLITGQVGSIDGVAVIVVPTSYLPENVNFVVTHRIATVAPKKLEEYRTHIDPPGISGVLVEGRLIHDAFVLENKKKAIYVSKAA